MRFAKVEILYYLINFVKKFRVFRVPETDVPPKYKNGILLITYEHMYLGVEHRH